MDIQIRNMTKSDIDRVGEILYEGFTAVASHFGYASNVSSLQEGKLIAWAMFRHGPSEKLVVEADGRVVGSTHLSLRGDVAGLGPTVIDPHFQGRSMGRELISAVLERAENQSSMRTILEAFNPAVFALIYFSLGFELVADLLDLILRGEVKQEVEPCGNVGELTLDDLDQICAYDSPRSGLDRRSDFTYFMRWGKVFAYRDQSQIRGYLACLPGSSWVQLGPLVAEGQEEAECLFRHGVASFKDQDFRTRIMARDHSLANALKGLGFRLYCTEFLMVRGPWRPSQYVEALGIFPEAA
jgi:N-acetylglutamate synthase-like GNAT family acetyltransferase